MTQEQLERMREFLRDSIDDAADKGERWSDILLEPEGREALAAVLARLELMEAENGEYQQLMAGYLKLAAIGDRLADALEFLRHLELPPNANAAGVAALVREWREARG